MLRSGGAARTEAHVDHPVRDRAHPGIARRAPATRVRYAWLLAFAASALLASIVALLWGTLALPASEIFWALAHPNAAGLAHAVVWDIRLPRLLIAAGVGAGLGVSGAMLQALFRNPLVDPYLTGVSAGAALAATIAFVAGVSFAVVPALAFAGGLLCALIVVAVATSDARGSNLRLVLAGVAVSALCSAAITLLLMRSGEAGGLSILAWLAGSVSGRGWPDLAWLALYLSIGGAGAFSLVHRLNALRLGSEPAAGLGLNVATARWQTLAFAALIAGACVSVSGVVGFVGLMVPHAARRALGGDARRLLPASALLGATVVLVADTLSRAILPPTEIPLGVLLAAVGVPFFLAVARRPVEL